MEGKWHFQFHYLTFLLSLNSSKMKMRIREMLSLKQRFQGKENKLLVIYQYA